MRSDTTSRKQSGWITASALWLGVLTVAAVGFWAHSATERSVLRSRAYKLRHIDSQTARSLLERLDIGTDYNTLTEDVLIVTSDRSMDLVKATSVVTLADRQQPVEIRALLAPSKEMPAPPLKELAVRLRTLTLGTLENGPVSGSPNPAIVDVFEGKLIAIAEAGTLDVIEAEIEQWKIEHTPKAEPMRERDETSQPSLEELAAKLLSEHYGKTAETPQDVEAEPDAPTAAAEAQPDADDRVMRELMTALAENDRAEATAPEPRPQPRTDRAAPQDDPDAALRAALAMLLGAEQAREMAAPTEPETAAAPQDTPTPTPATPTTVVRPSLPAEMFDEELELTITLPEEVEIEALVELVGKQLGLNYMYDPAILRGQKVMLKIHDGRIKVGEMYSLLESVLRFRGFVMTRRDRLVTIAKQDDVASIDPVLRLAGEPIQPGDVVVSSVFELKYADTLSVQEMLRQMRLGSTFNAIPETGTLIVTDYAFRMDRIREVIAMVDIQGRPKDFQYRQLRYMQAADLVPKVEALAAQIQGVSVTVAAQPDQPQAPQIDPRTRRPVAQQPGQPGAAQPTEKQAVYLEADERTNRVMMIGYTEEIVLINQLIDSLDVGSFDLRFIKEYVIEYVEATEVVTVLNELGLVQVSINDPRQQQQQQMRPTPQRPQTPQQQQQQQQQQQPYQPGVARDTRSSEPYIALRAATNSLLVNATEEQHRAIEMVISHVDVLQSDQRTIQEYEIQYVDTESILNTLGELGIISPRQTMAQQTTARAGQQTQQPQQLQRGQQPQQPMMQETGPLTIPSLDGEQREITTQEPQIAVLTATNSLLVYATPRQHAAIAMVIAHADRQLDRMMAPYVVYALENQDPLELAEVLNKLIQETVEQQTDTARTGQAAPDARIQTRQTTQTVRLPSGEEQRIRIVPDEKTYSLIVYANQRNQQWVGDLIRELDEYRPQVLLDVTLVEITKDDSFTYDLDLIAKTYGGASLQSGQVGVALEPFTTSNFADARSTSGSGVAFFSSEKVQALLEVIETKGYGRIMAKPKLLVNDNQEGEINAETTTAVPQERTNVQIPATGGTPVTTTDVTFTDYTAGVNLKIRPHISKGNMLRLEINLNRVDFTLRDNVSLPSGSVPVPPDRLSSDVTTTATVPDGTTIILGGLEKVDQIKRTTKVPILGDLPLLGGLFRGVNNADKQSRLYVFVKANILRPGDQLEGMEDMRRVSERNRRAFEEIEERFQKAETWPGIKEQPLDPIRALEED